MPVLETFLKLTVLVYFLNKIASSFDTVQYYPGNGYAYSKFELEQCKCKQQNEKVGKGSVKKADVRLTAI